MPNHNIKYKKIKQLKISGCGQAWIVKRRSDGETLVMKEGPGGQTALREVQLLQKLQHPNVIRYVDHYQSGSNLCIVMEYADGGDLADLLASQHGQHLSQSAVVGYFSQIACAVEYVHRNKVLHRDLKPLNVFLMSSGEVKLGDFGISTQLQHSGEVHHTVAGTPIYMSPEQQRGSYTEAADVWALGCILFELMYLRRAFQNTADILKGRKAPAPLAAAGLYTTELKALLSRMLDENPSRRPTIRDIVRWYPSAAARPMPERRRSSPIPNRMRSPPPFLKPTPPIVSPQQQQLKRVNPSAMGGRGLDALCGGFFSDGTMDIQLQGMDAPHRGHRALEARVVQQPAGGGPPRVLTWREETDGQRSTDTWVRKSSMSYRGKVSNEALAQLF